MYDCLTRYLRKTFDLEGKFELDLEGKFRAILNSNKPPNKYSTRQLKIT